MWKCYYEIQLKPRRQSIMTEQQWIYNKKITGVRRAGLQTPGVLRKVKVIFMSSKKIVTVSGSKKQLIILEFLKRLRGARIDEANRPKIQLLMEWVFHESR